MLKALVLDGGRGAGVRLDRVVGWMIKGYSQHKRYEVVQELLLKQMKQGVGLIHDVKEIDFRLRLWLCNGYACQQ